MPDISTNWFESILTCPESEGSVIKARITGKLRQNHDKALQKQKNKFCQRPYAFELVV